MMEREPVHAARVGTVHGLRWVGRRRRLGGAQKEYGPWAGSENDAPKLYAWGGAARRLLLVGPRQRLGVAQMTCGPRVVKDREPVLAARVRKGLGLRWVEQRRRLGVARKKCGPQVVMDKRPVPAARARKEL